MSSFVLFVVLITLADTFPASESEAQSSLYEKKFGQLFDAIIENKHNDHEGDYCARQFVVDKLLIDKSVYNLVPDPSKVDVATVDCETVMETGLRNIRNTILSIFKGDGEWQILKTEKGADCALEKIHTRLIAEKFIIPAVLSRISISDEQKQAERKRFIKMLSEVADEISTC